MGIFPLTKLKKHTTKIGSGSTPKGGEKAYKSNGIPLIRSQNVLTNRLNLSNVALIDEEQHEKMKGSKVQPKDVLLNITGASIGRSCVVPINLLEANVNQHVCILRLRKTIDGRLLSIFLNSQFGQKQIGSFQSGGSREGLNFQQIGSFDIPMPPLPEQKAIADLLSTWDEAIEKTERLIQAKERCFNKLINSLIYADKFKRGHIQDFTKEISDRNSEQKINRVLSVTNHSGFVLPEEQFSRSVASSNLSNYKIVLRGQYAYNPSRINVGSIARLNDWNEGVLSPMYVVFCINESRVDSDFFHNWLLSHEARQRIAKSTQGSVRETVSFSSLGRIPFPLPNLNEQKEISAVLNAAQKEIDLLKQLAEKYKTQKRGLMQKMLTGIWRIKSEVINQYTEV